MYLILGSVDNPNIYPGYEGRPELPFQQIYSQFIPVSFTTASGSHLGAFFHPYANGSPIYDLIIDKKFNNPEAMCDDFRNMSFNQCYEDPNHLDIDSDIPYVEEDQSKTEEDSDAKISRIQEENNKTFSEENEQSNEEEWKNLNQKDVKISENDINNPRTSL